MGVDLGFNKKEEEFVIEDVTPKDRVGGESQNAVVKKAIKDRKGRHQVSFWQQHASGIYRFRFLYGTVGYRLDVLKSLIIRKVYG